MKYFIYYIIKNRQDLPDDSDSIDDFENKSREELETELKLEKRNMTWILGKVRVKMIQNLIFSLIIYNNI